MRSLAPVLVAIALIAAAPAASADAIPPDVAACNGKTAGAPCSVVTGASGTCAASKCTRLDYSKWDRDASSSPPSVVVDCLTCVASDSDAGSSGGADAGAQPAASEDSSGCAMAARKAGPWALALLPALVLALLGRRRDRV